MAFFALNILNVLTILTRLINNQYQGTPASPQNGAEEALAQTVFDIIVSGCSDPAYDTEQTSTLDFDSQSDFPGPQLVDIEEDDRVNDDIEEEMSSVELVQESIDVDFKYKENAVEYWKSGRKGRLSLKNVQHRYAKVTSLPQLRRWEQQVSSGGDRREKLYRVSEYVFNQLKTAIARQMIIHDSDIKRWAIEAQEELHVPNFQASHWWIQKFKRNHNIVSRKITKVRTRSQVSNAANIVAEATLFVRSLHNLIPEYGLDSIYNTDQSGFNLEMHSGRTLAERGSKKVETVVQSVSATTHSYTIQPTISASGKLLSPLLVCLKEVSGSLGPKVEQTMFRPPNVYIMATKSGKLTKQLVIEWVKNVYAPHVGRKTLLLMDSWSGQSPEDVKDAVPLARPVTVKTIPKGATGIIQPLDVYGFRFWKQFVRQLSDTIALSSFAIQLHQRDNILRMQGLTHLQFSSPRYTEFIQYGWYKSGYLQERPGRFTTPVDFSFHDSQLSSCNICGAPVLIRCGWCKQYLCIQHFFNDYHNVQTIDHKYNFYTSIFIILYLLLVGYK